MNKAQLTERIGQLETELEAAKAATTDEVVASLRSENDTLVAAKAELEGRITGLETELAEAKETAEMVPELQEMVRKLNGRSIVEHAAADPSKPVFEHDGVTGRVNHGANVKGINYTAQQIATNPAVIAHLVKIKSSAITINNA